MKYQLRYKLKVYDSKYREFVNTLENHLSTSKPTTCINRNALQCIKNLHFFEYVEEWTSIKEMNDYMTTSEFTSLRGAFKLLTEIRSFTIAELKEVKSSSVY